MAKDSTIRSIWNDTRGLTQVAALFFSSFALLKRRYFLLHRCSSFQMWSLRKGVYSTLQFGIASAQSSRSSSSIRIQNSSAQTVRLRRLWTHVEWSEQSLRTHQNLSSLFTCSASLLRSSTIQIRFEFGIIHGHIVVDEQRVLVSSPVTFRMCVSSLLLFFFFFFGLIITTTNERICELSPLWRHLSSFDWSRGFSSRRNWWKNDCKWFLPVRSAELEPVRGREEFSWSGLVPVN